MRRICVGLGLLVVILTGCDDSATGSNAVLAPESPLIGRVISVDEDQGSFVVETRDGGRVSFPIGEQSPDPLEELRRSAEPVEVVPEVRDGELVVVAVRPASDD